MEVCAHSVSFCLLYQTGRYICNAKTGLWQAFCTCLPSTSLSSRDLLQGLPHSLAGLWRGPMMKMETSSWAQAAQPPFECWPTMMCPQGQPASSCTSPSSEPLTSWDALLVAFMGAGHRGSLGHPAPVPHLSSLAESAGRSVVFHSGVIAVSGGTCPSSGPRWLL